MSPEIKIYKITYSGRAEQIIQENIINNFSLFDILTFYIPKHKRMYIWIGKKASPSLKNHISQIRKIILEVNPNLIVLRNITIESGSEPPEFLDLIGIIKDDLTERIRDLEIKLLPSFSEIKKLKEKADKFFISENYEEAIEAAEKIIKIANEIEDLSLEQDQINFIEEAQLRFKAIEVLHQIENESKKMIALFDQLVSNKDYHSAHKLAEDFKQKNEDKYPLASIPIAQQLILKDENLIYNRKLKQEEIKNVLEQLENKYKNNLNDRNLNTVKQILNTIDSHLKKVIDEKLEHKWNQYKKQYLTVKREKIEDINNLSNEAIDHLDKGKLKDALDLFEKIVSELYSFI